MRTILLRRAAALGASAALAVGGLAALSPAATAASTSLKFNCSASILKDQEFVLDVEIELPESVNVGDAVESSFSGTVSAPESVRSAAYGLLQGRALGGTAVVKGSFGGQAIELAADVPRTDIPSAGPGMSLAVAGGGKWVAKEVGTHDVTIPGFTAALVMTKADDSTTNLAVNCEAKAPDAVVGTVKVTKAMGKAKSVTTVKKAKFAKKKKRINVTAQVRTADKKAAKGKVKVTLKQGKKTVKVIKGKKLNKKGIAKVNFTKITKKGKYKVIVQYQGNKNLKKSKKNRVIRVK